MYSKAYTDNQQKDHTAMAFVIESLDDKKFSELMQNLINKNSDSKNQLQDNTVFSKDGQYLNAFEYAVKNNQPEKAKVIAANLEKINSYNMIVEKDGGQYTALGWLIKAGEIDFILQNQNKFGLNDNAYTDNQNKSYNANQYMSKKIKDDLKGAATIKLKDFESLDQRALFDLLDGDSILSLAIDKLEKSELGDLIENICNNPGVKNQLQYNTVFSEDGQYLNDFEYAVKIGEFDKAAIIANNLYIIEGGDNIVNKDEEGNQYSAIGYLIKKGRSDILIENKGKFDFLNGYAYKDSEGREYSLNEYLSDIHKDTGLEQTFNPNKEIKEKLRSTKDQEELSLENLQKLTHNDLLEIKDNKTILSMAIEKLDKNDFANLINDMPKNISYYPVYREGNKMRLKAFEYAVKIGNFNNAQVIADKLEKINNDNMIFEEKGEQYTAIGLFIKNKPQFILENKEKFDLEYETAYRKDEKFYNVKDYVVDVLKDEALAKALGLLQ